jgi:hypothetical protein
VTDRRATFFLAAGLVCALLIPLSDPKHRWVPVSLAVVYVLLAAASALDRRSRSRVQPRYRARQ